MSEPFLAEIRILGFNFAPRGWAMCDGQLLPINQNQALFSLLGTTYGGDGRTSFALPDLRGRTPIHEGSSGGANYTLGQKSGEEWHTLSTAEMPQHDHGLMAANALGDQQGPGGGVFASTKAVQVALYATPASLVDLNPGTVANAGGSQAHPNLQPFVTLNFCIALQGIFPSHS